MKIVGSATPSPAPPFPFRHIFSLHLLVYFINYFIFAIQPRKYHSKTHATMETKTNALDPQRSLELIADMVANSRRRLERHIGTPLLVWGSIITVTTLVVWRLLSATGNPLWNLLWLAIPVIGWPLDTLTRRRYDAEPTARTWFDGILSGLWRLFGGVAIGLGCIAIALPLLDITTPILPIVPLLILLLGFTNAATGLLLRNRPVLVIGILTAIPGAAGAFAIAGYDVLLLFAGIAGLNVIVPGWLLNRRARKGKQA